MRGIFDNHFQFKTTDHASYRAAAARGFAMLAERARHIKAASSKAWPVTSCTSLGLSAWKQHRGSRWALRCNPSSGNLHPTEGYADITRWR
ncbi:MAG: hypothetical protein EA420_04215 [Candidatus Competibacteraceae bacterium]|nr:MAG: hypothetical protein EA420_04215 [Candidatus Competibacteraceae bacterium]